MFLRKIPLPEVPTPSFSSFQYAIGDCVGESIRDELNEILRVYVDYEHERVKKYKDPPNVGIFHVKLNLYRALVEYEYTSYMGAPTRLSFERSLGLLRDLVDCWNQSTKGLWIAERRVVNSN